MSAVRETNQPPEFAALRAEWQEITEGEAQMLPRWEAVLSSMSIEMAALKSQREWVSGGYTLLHALGLHHNEVYMCRALAWLLRPDAGHGLGASVLNALLERCGVPESGSDRATVITEESRANTRADIVVRSGDSTLLIEAKVFAPEQERQCTRLADLWGDESPTLVFLTRDGHRPRTAGGLVEAWHRLRWRDVGQMISEAARDKVCSAGVHEVAHTIDAYGG